MGVGAYGHTPLSRGRAVARIGVLGGTFDPVHLGHLVIAENARCCLDLDKVLFIPAGQPWLKVSTRRDSITAAEHRLAMVRLAIASNPAFELDTREVERQGPSYSVDTLEELRVAHPSGTEFYFIVGWDLLGQLPAWHQPQRLLELCRLVAVPRPSYHRPLDRLEAVLPGIGERLVSLDWPRLAISASNIRQRRAQGLSIRYLVPPEVLGYIEEHGLYANRPS
ncbi:MAG: nicotinate-nucleotide adenylyltransferase [Chloroflexi bacterium]|nr:nicotinate-nucleotide adenylyltransferase [Chloroflexota bacterium]